MSKTTFPTIDYDGKWKRLIELYPQWFIQFFLPEIYDLIDFSKNPKMIIQDLAKIISAPDKKGDKITDLVMEVHLKNGQIRLLYVHIEVQSAWIGDFDEKMYVPFYRLRDKYRQEVTSFALFVGETLPKNPGEYTYEFGKTFVLYRYPYYICKNQREEDLLKMKNPFTIAVLACKFLADYKKKQDTPKLLEQKIRLVEEYILKKCSEWGYGKDVIYALNDFVLNIVLLPKTKEKEFTNRYLKEEEVMNESTTNDRYSPEFVAKFTEMGLTNRFTQLEAERKKEREEARLKIEKIKREMKAIQLAEQKKLMLAQQQELLAKEKEKAAKQMTAEVKKIAKSEHAEKIKLEKKLQKSVVALSKEAGFDNAKIAKILNLELAYVTKTIQTHTKSSTK